MAESQPLAEAAESTQNSLASKTTTTQPTGANTEKKPFSFLMSDKSRQEHAETTSSQALNVSLGLFFILLLIFSMAWFMRKMGYSNISGQGHLKVLATLNLGQKEKIALVQVGKQQLLVGITASQINTLHVLDEPLETEHDNAVTEAGFAKKLSESLAHLTPSSQKKA